VADQTITERIRGAIDAGKEAGEIDVAFPGFMAPDHMLVIERDALAERIERALFGGPYQDSKQLLLELVALKQSELEALTAAALPMARCMLHMAVVATGPYGKLPTPPPACGICAGCKLAAILREPAQESHQEER